MKNLFKVYPDFPKPGINFLDINSVIEDRQKLFLMNESIERLANDMFPDNDYSVPAIDKVVVIESRGFLFGNTLATCLGSGMNMVRKPGKLPGEIISESYGTEYSDDKLEIQVCSIKPGDKVIIHDDVLATGGTALAAAKLVERLGGIVKGFIFIGEIEVCEGRSLLKDYPRIESLIKF